MGYPITQGNTVQPLLFLLISSADHLTGLTGKAGSVVVTISKNGGAFATPTGTINELANGWYYVAANATDASAVGPLALHAKDAASDPVDELFPVGVFNPLLASLGLVLANGTIDIPTFTNPAWEVLSARRLSSTGVTSPLTADTYKLGGFDSNGKIYYASTTLVTPQFMWNNGAGWTISSTLLTNGASFWTTGSTSNVLGPYSAQGSATGIPAVTFSGGAMLDSLQLGVTLPATDGTGRVVLQPVIHTGATIPTVTNVGTLTTYAGNTVQTGDNFARIGVAGAGLTALGDARLANLDAAVSTRSTYAGGDTAGTTTILSRLTSTRAGYLDNLSAGAVALTTQIPAHFTNSTFVSDGVFAGAAFANIPTSSLGTNAPVGWLNAAAFGSNAISTQQVASVANLVGVALSSGIVSVSPSPTNSTFTATGASLNTTPGGYTTAPMSIFWQPGSANAGFKYAIAVHNVSGNNHAFTTGPMANIPNANDPFVIG